MEGTEGFVVVVMVVFDFTFVTLIMHDLELRKRCMRYCGALYVSRLANNKNIKCYSPSIRLTKREAWHATPDHNGGCMIIGDYRSIRFLTQMRQCHETVVNA